MRKLVLLTAAIACASFLPCKAQSNLQSKDYEAIVSSDEKDDFVKVEDSRVPERLSPVYMDYVKADDWKGNWWLGVQGGASFFIGNPNGCGDVFDRSMMNFNVSVGKWITPQVGLRVNFQGLKFKDCELQKQNYFALHGDFMFNLASLFRSPDNANPRWDLSPYVGIGIAKGATLSHDNCPCKACNGSNWPFLIAYGIQARYRISERVHLTGEIGNFTTMADFDNYGVRRHLSDNMLSVSAGLSVTIGRVGWKRAIDARPYIEQNDYLIDYCRKLEDVADNVQESNREQSTYGGLEALKARLMQRHEREMAQLREDQEHYNDSIRAARAYNIPIYFFFKRGTAQLTDRSQLVNLDELVRVTKEHNLTLRIDGAADAATGTVKGNRNLSIQRSKFLAKELKKRGIDVKNIKGVALGGIRQHKRIQEDRYAKVAIYVDLSENHDE